MNCNISTNINRITILTAAIFMMAAGSAMAQIQLSWAPSDTTTLAPGESTRVSIFLEEAINFRTIEVTVNYDTTVVKSLGGGSGALYTESGYFVFDGFEEDPGSWHGYAIIMGAGEYVTGPGEVLFWDIEGLDLGVSPIISVEALIYDEASPPNLLADVVLDTATVIVEDALSAVPEIPAFSNQLMVAPNPFNPRTLISFDMPRETLARLTVYDMRGRQIALLYDGIAPAGILQENWNGTDNYGQAQPGGVYLFQLKTDDGIAWAKGILVK